jgi:hypothetical protein
MTQESEGTPPAWMRAIGLAIRCLLGALAVYITIVLLVAGLGGELPKVPDLLLRAFLLLVAVLGFMFAIGEDHGKQKVRRVVANQARPKPPSQPPPPPRFDNWPDQ